jgi:hypothetical protein
MGSYHVDEKFYSRHTKLWPSEADLWNHGWLLQRI